MTDNPNNHHESKAGNEVIIGRIVAADFSGEKTIVTFECDRRGPWRPQLAALVIEKDPAHD